MANTNKVPNDFGGGINGHLGLVLLATEDIFMSKMPYVKTLHPGPLPPVDNNNLPGTVVARREYKDSLCLFENILE